MTAGDLVVPGEVELLERALAWTCGQLARVRPEQLGAPTPCAGWDLAALLAHMEDALDAFAEAAAGFVVPVPDPRLEAHPVPRVPLLQAKASALLGAWARPTPRAVRTGSVALPTAVLVAAAALEVAVHGWDVAVALDPAPARRPALPAPLARDLLGVAGATVVAQDRPARFAPPVPPPFAASHGERLLCFLGRDPRR
ncbi:TIGR03086 family protein [Nocardioides sp. ChNu-153]|uniref:TIGR03086 family metal-binding protein n=1 Tax=unclassified Nocardioides TaxID=2615069 RepID=UPI0024054BCF|nr:MULTISPECIES: TIGR03086 family metal-binding protein [unclassified Nocardioides]MDF9716167.1 TIGR03086 family protein [Nocardioides sp. ChNu-99]MDN7121557.1 TIGR03086 family protein [Nocardioides sp. ChNu-153]